MKKLILGIIGAAMCAASGQAQLLWKVIPANGGECSYVLGTHHLAPSGMIDSVRGLRDAIGGVERVYGELDMSVMNAPETQMVVVKALQAPADSTLGAVLTKEQYDSVGVIIKKYFGAMASIDQMQALKPAAVATQLALAQNMMAVPGFNPMEQFDMTVQTAARGAGKEVKGLETLEFQMNLLYGDPVSEQAEALMKSIRNEEEGIEMSRRLAKAYLSGDLDGMMVLSLDPELGMDEEAAQKLIYDRNSAWADELEGVIPGKRVLVAVGAGHLPGAKGLLQLLKNKGFKIEEVK